MAQSYNIVIVGGGAAGCVLAARLSERPSCRVLLLEAGEDLPPGKEPGDVTDLYPTSYFNSRYFWPGLKARWRADAGETPFPQARVIGGGGSVMGMVALRGVAGDYDRWRDAGAAGWGWQDVLPYFNRLERDLDFMSDGHGKFGPMPIRRLKRDEWPPLARAVDHYGQAHKLTFIEDMNLDFRDGYGAVPMSNTDTRRASSALCYLTPEVRRRPNLTIMAQAMATRILFDGTRVKRVRAAVRRDAQEFEADEVILAAGAIYTPALLLRSGIGPAAQLEELGIAVIANRRGVGANLQNHPVLFIGMHLRQRARQDAALRTTPALSLRYSSGVAGCNASDLYINVQSKTAWHALGRHIANVSPVLLQPKSRGAVTLVGARPNHPPRVDFRFLDHELDIARMESAFLTAAELAIECGNTIASGRPFTVSFGNRIRRLNDLSRRNALKAKLIAGTLNTMPWLADGLLALAAGQRVRLRNLLEDREALREHVLDNVAGVFHPAGTCRMGPESDPSAVVDNEGRVHGVAGLRVADASVMPAIVSGNTNLPTLMIAEKMAASIAARR